MGGVGLEEQELVDKLNRNGFGRLLDVLYHEVETGHKVFTKKGKLNKSGACRALGCKPKELEESLRSCQHLLGEDWS